MAANGDLKAGNGDNIVDRGDSKNRHIEKLKVINGHDSYELPKHTWQDDISLCHQLLMLMCVCISF